MLPLYCIKLDVRKAFDSLSHPALQKTLTDSGVPDDLVSAAFRELLGVELYLKYGDIVSEKVLSLIGVPQGDPGSLLYFASTIDRFLRPLIVRWKAAGVGLTLSSDDVDGEGTHMPLLAWMDDFYLFSTSPEEATRMVRDICNNCEPAGLRLQPAKCTWITTVSDCDAVVIARGQTLTRLGHEEGLEVLGTLVSFSGGHSLEHNSRIGKAWRAFWAHSSLLLNPRVGVYRRLSLLNSVVGPSPMWGAGGAIHSKRQRQRYNATQNVMAAQIVCTRRRAGEGWLDWFKRSRRVARDLLRKLGFAPWGTTLQLRVLSWAGHVARFPPDRLCQKVLYWRNLQWWRKRQSLIALGLGGLRHPQGPFGKPMRWDEKIAACAEWISDVDSGPTDWIIRAQNRDP